MSLDSAATETDLLSLDSAAIILQTTPRGLKQCRPSLEFVSMADGREGVTHESIDKHIAQKNRRQPHRCHDEDFSKFKTAPAKLSPFDKVGRKTEWRVHVFPLAPDCNDPPKGIVIKPEQWQALLALARASGVVFDGPDACRSDAKRLREALASAKAIVELLEEGRGLHIERRRAE